MKDKKPFIIQLVIGVILISSGLITQFNYYSTMLFAMGSWNYSISNFRKKNVKYALSNL